MDLKDKVRTGLRPALGADFVNLDDDDGISGFVVSRLFEGMSTLDRQGKIEEALQKVPLTQEERRRILMIAGLTPEEYEAVGARIRVHKVREKARGTFEIVLHGGPSDAEYVRGVLNKKGFRTTEPKQIEGAIGVFMSFRAEGPEGNTLTKEKVIRILKKDQYIEVLANT